MSSFKKFCLFISFFIVSLFLQNSEAKAWVDLSFNGITVSPENPAINEECVITVKIGVSTNETISDGSWVNSYSYSVEDFDKESITLPVVNSTNPLEDGSVVNYIIKGTFNNSGDQKVIFRANGDEILAESKMSNNNGTTEVTVRKAHNITATKISIYPENPIPYQDCAITVTLKNNGYMELDEEPGYHLYFDDFQKSNIEHDFIVGYNTLEPGEETTYIINGNFSSEGEKNMKMSFDVDKKLDETNEDDNSIAFTHTVVSKELVNLATESIELSEDTILINKDIKITVLVKNINLVNLEDDEGFAVEDDNFSFPDFTMKKISHSTFPSKNDLFENEEYVSYTFEGRFTKAGEKNIWFNFNVKDKLFEFNYDDNYLEKNITVYSSTDQVNNFELLSEKIEYADADTAIISWTTSKEATGELSIKMYDTNTQADVYKTAEGLTHSVTINDLKDLKKYFYSIEVFRGDKNHKTIYKAFSKLLSNDAIISNGPKAQIIGSSSIITWHTNMLANSCVYYKAIEQEDYTENCTEEKTMDHEIEIDQLLSGNYQYYITTKSETGNKIESTVGEFKIKDIVSIEEIYSEPETPTRPNDSSIETPNKDTDTDVDNNLNENISNKGLYSRLKGKILIKVEDAGKAFYVNPQEETRHYLGKPDDAFAVMREQGVGISNLNLEKIEVAKSSGGVDTDNDGLSDMFEDAIGTDKNNSDSDADGYSDGDEVQDGYNPQGSGKIQNDSNFTSSNLGKIFLQVEGVGEAWYVNPADNKRYFLGRPADAFNVMRNLGLGISNNDFDSL